MFYSGIADEAGKPLDWQIKAHKEIGFDYIELRNIEGVNLTDLGDAEFENVFRKVTEAGLKVSCFASQLANWARPVWGDFQIDVNELSRAVPRMKRFGSKFIRCMSWPNDKENPWPEEKWRAEVVRRMKELARIAEESGVVLVHENCDGWGGIGPEQTLELLSEVGSQNLKLVFDTGNPVPHGQDGWEYYNKVKEHIVYVHIKDFQKKDGEVQACFPGEGLGKVKEILSDLLASGYDGGLSIEPHLAAIVHLGKEAENPQEGFRLYTEYGKRLKRLVGELAGQQPA